MIYKNLIHKLEFTVRELLGADMSPEDIHSLVNIILNDWLVDGEFTEEYRSLAVAAIKLRESAQEPTSGIVNINGNRIVSGGTPS
jgi:hypothetical protein